MLGVARDNGLEWGRVQLRRTERGNHEKETGENLQSVDDEGRGMKEGGGSTYIMAQCCKNNDKPPFKRRKTGLRGPIRWERGRVRW